MDIMDIMEIPVSQEWFLMFVCCLLTSIVETAIGISTISVGVRTVISTVTISPSISIISIVSISLWLSFSFGHLLVLNRSFGSKSIGYWVTIGVRHIVVTVGIVWTH